jgi:hypothetical protein
MDTTERMRITSGGNVCIGSTSSTYKLSVVTSSANGLFINTSGSDFGNPSIAMLNGITDSTISSTSNGLEITTYSSHPMLFRTNISERMRITSGGNVLIGTTTDAGFRLDVNGTGRFSSSVIVGGGVGNKIELKDGAAWPIIRRNTSTGGIIFDTEGASIAGSIFSVKTLNGSDFLSINSGGVATFSSTVTATGFFQSSDERLKDIISRNGDVITYKWKDGRDNKNHIGYSAQEVQKVMPDAVNESEDGMLSVNYIEVLVKKMAEMEKEIAYLKSKL